MSTDIFNQLDVSVSSSLGLFQKFQFPISRYSGVFKGTQDHQLHPTTSLQDCFHISID